MKRHPMAAALLIFSVLATPAGASDPRAAELVQEATALTQKGDLDPALDKLRQAIDLTPDNFRIHFQLASLLAAQGRFPEAGPAFGRVVELDPTNSAARRGEITAILFEGRYGAARVKLEEGLTALPRDGQLAHTLARLCATAPLDKVRNGALALQLAEKVYDIKKTYDTGETLAMAYAESGRFTEALELQRGLIAKAEQEGDTSQVEQLRERLLSYLQGEPWRAASPAEIAMATEPPKSPGP